jgi:hypothetical protein
VEEFNSIQPTINFTIEKENEKINYLDITIQRKMKDLNSQYTETELHNIKKHTAEE